MIPVLLFYPTMMRHEACNSKKGPSSHNTKEYDAFFGRTTITFKNDPSSALFFPPSSMTHSKKLCILVCSLLPNEQNRVITGPPTSPDRETSTLVQVRGFLSVGPMKSFLTSSKWTKNACLGHMVPLCLSVCQSNTRA